MPLPGFTAQITLTRSRRIYRSGGAYATRHAGARVTPADADCSVDWLTVGSNCLDAAIASAPDNMDGDWTQFNFHLAEATTALAFHQYCHP